jgi:hypothetical protein
MFSASFGSFIVNVTTLIPDFPGFDDLAGVSSSCELGSIYLRILDAFVF